jgi:zinc-finger
VRTGRPFHWLEASQVRHAFPAEATPCYGEEITSLCGEPVVIAQRDPNRECPYPECPECDRLWCEVGIPQRQDRLRGLS